MARSPIPRDGNTGWVSSSCSGDGQFGTSNVGLSSVKGSSRMQSNDFSSKEIISRSEIGRNSEGHSSMVCIESVRRSVLDCLPVSVGGLSDLSRLIYLEPTVASGKSLSCFILGHESHERSLMTSCDPLIISRSFITISGTMPIGYSHRRSSGNGTLCSSRISSKRHEPAGIVRTSNSSTPLASRCFLHDGI